MPMIDARVTNKILTAANEVAMLDIAGAGAVGVQLIDAQIGVAWNGTVTFEASLDGLTWVTLNMTPSNTTTPATTANAAGCWSGNCGGYRFFRARLSTATAGGVRVNLQSAGSGGK